jgi:hypothetical protein
MTPVKSETQILVPACPWWGSTTTVCAPQSIEDWRKTNRQQKKREGLVFSNPKDRAGIPLATTSSPAWNFSAVLRTKNENI